MTGRWEEQDQRIFGKEYEHETEKVFGAGVVRSGHDGGR